MNHQRPWEHPDLEPEQRVAEANQCVYELEALLSTQGWDILSGHLTRSIEHARDALELNENDDAVNRGMIRSNRAVLSFPTSLIAEARRFIEREDNK